MYYAINQKYEKYNISIIYYKIPLEIFLTKLLKRKTSKIRNVFEAKMKSFIEPISKVGYH